MQYWKKYTHKEQDEIITRALSNNVDYHNNISLGIPVSKLDQSVFYEHASFLKDAPLLRAYVQNPNHIGCHTMGESESFFKGTQQLEHEVIELLSVDMLKAVPNSCDGYVAAGGTEANMQAAWIYRNRFMEEFNATTEEIALLSSADTHYSVDKAANLLHLTSYRVPVDDTSRTISEQDINATVKQAMSQGIKYFIVISNMATTMFGSVDDPDMYARCLTGHKAPFNIHVDGAFGGFIYPVSSPANKAMFSNPNVSSITLDAHKMLQAPYGTGIFIARKGLMHYVFTKEAQYVNGMDITLSGSRSGTNAIAIWMILFTYGPYGWLEKINKLLYRTDWLCHQLDELGIPHYRHPAMNIVTIRANAIPTLAAVKYGLVPDTHNETPAWYKIVVMDHVEIDLLKEFIRELRQTV